MQFNYNFGFLPVCITGFTIFLFVCLVINNLNPKFSSKILESVNDRTGVFVAFILATVYVLTFILLVYPIVNVLSQLNIAFSIDFIKSELANGTLPLRVSSFIIGYRFVTSATKPFTQRKIPFRQYLYKPCQYAFYTFPLFLLWLATIIGESSLGTILLSWTIVFILDDWIIIDDYTDKFKSSPLASHIDRIIGFNFIIFILFSITILFHFHFILSIILIPVLFVLGGLVLVGGVQDGSFDIKESIILRLIGKYIKSPK